MANFKRLTVWAEALDLVDDIYRATRSFPDSERFGLTSQMRRAACSIGANIAEGSGRLGDRELARFLRIAAGSASELESHLLHAQRLGFLRPADGDPLVRQTILVRQRLYRLHHYLVGRASRVERSEKPKHTAP